MNDVTVRKDDLMDVISTNRDAHRAEFERALEGYRRKCLEALEAKLADLHAGRTPELHFVLPVPRDHTADYDRILRMIHMEVADTITLDEASFAQYVMDDWAWKREFAATSAFYVA